MTGTMTIRARLSTLFTGKVPEQAVVPTWPIAGAIGAAGVKITADTALKIGAVWKAINLLSSSVGKLPMILYRRQGEGKTRDSSNPLYGLIRYNATPEISQMDLRQTVTAHALLHGNGYAYILRDPTTFQPLEIWPLSPSNTCAVRETDLSTGQSQVLYATYVNNQMFRLPAYNVIHIKGLGNDALSGYSVIRYFADDGSLTAGMRDYSAAFFRNGARPNVVLTHPGTLKPDSLERLKASWANAHQGIDNAHGTAVLEEGMQIKEMQINARDAQLLEARNYQIRDIANWFSVPPHKLGDNSRIAYTSMEAENQSFLDESLDAWLIRWELEFRNKLLTEEQKRSDSHIIEFLRAALLRADMAARGQFYAQAVGGPWMTADEARAAENLNSIEGGSTLLRPLNMGGESGAEPDEDDTEEETPT